MNNNSEISTNIDAVTIDIPVRVTMISYDDASTEFTTSIDELGQIVLTPVSKDAEFTNVSIYDDTDSENFISNQESITTVDDSITTTEIPLIINASMLRESEDSSISAVVDEIGQIIIYPVAEKNVFVTAVFKRSLNLITEEMQEVEYCDYRLVNTGDGWDVFSPEGEKLEEGLATIHEAKILVCTSELEKLKRLTENVSEDNTSDTQEDKQSDNKPEVTAEVIEEKLDLTQEDNKQEIISRFMQGDIALFSDSGVPLDTYIPLPQLDAKGYNYFYDEESDAIVSYPTVE